MEKTLKKSIVSLVVMFLCVGLLSVTAVAEDSDDLVISSDQTISDETIEGDVYVVQDVTLTTTDEVTITGDVYVFGTLENTGTLTVSGTLYCLRYDGMSAGDYDYGYFINSGSAKIETLHVKDDYLDTPIPDTSLDSQDPDEEDPDDEDADEEDSDDEDPDEEDSNDGDSDEDNSGVANPDDNDSGTDSTPDVTDIKKINGTWTYTVNGKADYTYTGFASNSNGKWYVEKGIVTFNKNSVLKDSTGAIGSKGTWWYVVGSKVQTSFTGLADYSNSNGWWYINNGKVTFDQNTVAKNKNGWYYVEDSKVIFSYNGYAENKNGWWYIEGGKVTFNKNGVIKDDNKKIDGAKSWWYVLGSKVQTSFTGLADYKNSNGWWYITKGKVTFDVDDVAKNKNGWYYVKDSKVDFSYNGYAKNKNGWWYLENGKVTFKKNGVIQDTNKKIDGAKSWWYVLGSKVQTSFTGLADYKNSNGWWYITKGKVTFDVDDVAKNKNGWYYVKESKVDFSYNGFAENKNGWWYLENGKVTFKKNSVIQDKNKKIDGAKSWWYVVGSKVQKSFTGLADYSNSNGWWYISNGKVTFDVDDVAKNKNGWYYVRSSKVDFSYTGIAENKNGWWYIKNGKVDFSAGDYSFAKNTSQIIDVKASGSTGTLTLYNKNGSSFTKKLSTSCYVGENGITSESKKKEGDKKTPSGVYTLGQAFGIASDPGCTRDYLKVNSNYYWVNDSTSKYYNQLVDITKTGLAWKSAEHLINYTTAYKYAIAIDYNTSCTPNKGSAYFLHCSRGKPTAGCVAVSETNMVKILQSLKSDTRIYIH